MNQEQTAEAVWDLLGHAVEGRGDEAAQALVHIGSSVDANRMYGVCCALAEAGTFALKKLFAPAAFAGPSMYGIHQLKHGTDPAEMWGARFLVAYANGDRQMALALFEAALKASDEEYVVSVSQLVCTVAGVIITATGEGAQ